MHKHCFTVDVEDGISIAMRDAFGKQIPQTDRVVSNTNRILDLMAKYNTKGTFFTLGQVAEHFPDLIKRIANEGHELGVHGYDHWQFFKLSPEQAFEEISSAKKIIEDISGAPVYGHRAPAFSIMPETQWGLEMIEKAGFVYDTSIMPCKMNRYGWPEFPKATTKVVLPDGKSLIEVPLSVDKLFFKEVPVCGGGYLRLFPFAFSKNSFEKVSQKRPVIVYIHPYEVDPNRYPDFYFEELQQADWKKRLKMKSFWINRASVFPKLEKFLQMYAFEPMITMVEKTNNPPIFKVEKE